MAPVCGPRFRIMMEVVAPVCGPLYGTSLWSRVAPVVVPGFYFWCRISVSPTVSLGRSRGVLTGPSNDFSRSVARAQRYLGVKCDKEGAVGLLFRGTAMAKILFRSFALLVLLGGVVNAADLPIDISGLRSSSRGAAHVGKGSTSA